MGPQKSIDFTPIVDRLDKRWLRESRSVHRRDLQRISRQLWQPGRTVLDVGCGNGLYYEQLPDVIKPLYTGVDKTPKFIEMCQNRYPEGRFIQADALNLPFEDRSFDIVVNTALLQHIPEWREALREIARVARLYLVTTTRTTLGPTEVSPVVEIYSWRFNLFTMLAEHRKYGRCRWQWTVGTDGNRYMTAIYVTVLKGPA